MNRSLTSRFCAIGMVFCLSVGLLTSFGQDRSAARSMVITRQGIVATSHTLASQAGAQILARGPLRLMRLSPRMPCWLLPSL